MLLKKLQSTSVITMENSQYKSEVLFEFGLDRDLNIFNNVSVPYFQQPIIGTSYSNYPVVIPNTGYSFSFKIQFQFNRPFLFFIFFHFFFIFFIFFLFHFFSFSSFHLFHLKVIAIIFL